MLKLELFGIQNTELGRPTCTLDHDVAFLCEGRSVDLIQLERFTQVEPDHRLPQFVTQILAPFVPPGELVRFVTGNHFVGDCFISAAGLATAEARSRTSRLRSAVSNSRRKRCTRYRHCYIRRRRANAFDSGH